MSPEEWKVVARGSQRKNEDKEADPSDPALSCRHHTHIVSIHSVHCQ
jgi:hypothetical protein